MQCPLSALPAREVSVIAASFYNQRANGLGMKRRMSIHDQCTGHFSIWAERRLNLIYCRFATGCTEVLFSACFFKPT